MSTVVLETAVKSTFVIGAATAVNMLVLRRASAACRHFVWTLAVIGLVLLPILPIAFPRWGIPILVSAPTSQGTDAATVRGPLDEGSSVVPATAVPGVREVPKTPSGRALSWFALVPALYAVGVLLMLSRMVV